MTLATSRSTKTSVLIVCLLLGWMGAHRFMVGKWFTGLIWFVTLGFFFIGWAIDFLLIAFGAFNDADGLPLR